MNFYAEAAVLLMYERLQERQEIREARQLRELRRREPAPVPPPTRAQTCPPASAVETTPSMEIGDLKQRILDGMRAVISAVRPIPGGGSLPTGRSEGTNVTHLRRSISGAAVSTVPLDRLSLEEFVDLSLTCGYVPLEPSFVTIEDAVAFIQSAPHLPLSPQNVERWRAQREVRQALAAGARHESQRAR